jgi:ArsR family transcriptional regulator
VLQRQELQVSELCSVLQLPQSTASRHLKVLSEGGWVRARRESTSRLYVFNPSELDPPIQQLWSLVRQQLNDAPMSGEDHRRLDSVLARRRIASREFFTSAAGRWDALRRELFGGRFDLQALLGLLGPDWVFGDLACGTGSIAEAVAPFVHRVIAVDDSRAMLDAARRRLAPLGNVEVHEGQLERLPMAAEVLDAAALVLTLHHNPEPVRVLAEVHRVLRPGGRILLADMMPHDREEYRRQMGHLWLGFSRRQILEYLDAAGFVEPRHRLLPAAPEAKGPSLFVATARRREQAQTARNAASNR